VKACNKWHMFSSGSRAALRCRQLGITTRCLSSGTEHPSKRTDVDQPLSKGSTRANAKLRKQEEKLRKQKEAAQSMMETMNSAHGRLNFLKQARLQGAITKAEANKLLDLNIPITVEAESIQTVPKNARQRIEVSHARNSRSFYFLP
jgi:hypothetical protein